MIEMNVKVNFPDECLDLLNTKDVAVLAIPVTPDELLYMREAVAVTRAYLGLNATPLSEPSQVTRDIFEGLCLLLARAVARTLDTGTGGKLQ